MDELDVIAKCISMRKYALV